MSNRTAQADRAVKLARKREQQLVGEGKGTRDWTPEQQRDILTDGVAKDENGFVFRGHHMQSVELFPQYQGEPGNIQFLSVEEHLKAHDGWFRNLTNWYYNPVTGEKEPFEDDIFEPCKEIYLSAPVCPPNPKNEETVESIEEKPDNIKEKQKDSKKGVSEAITGTSKPVQMQKEHNSESPHESASADTTSEQHSDIHDTHLLEEDLKDLLDLEDFDFPEYDFESYNTDRMRGSEKKGLFDRIRDRIDRFRYEHPCISGFLEVAGPALGEVGKMLVENKIESMIDDAYRSTESALRDNRPNRDDNDVEYSVNDRYEAPVNPGFSDDNDGLSPSTLGMMKKESFMKEAGYSTHLSPEERQSILTDLLKDHSRQEIEDRLNLNMNLKKNSRKNYDDALAAWQQDLDFLQDDEPDD